MAFWRFVGPQGVHRVPNGFLLGALRRRIDAQFGIQSGIMVPELLPGLKKEPFWDTLGSVLGAFWSPGAPEKSIKIYRKID